MESSTNKKIYANFQMHCFNADKYLQDNSNIKLLFTNEVAIQKYGQSFLQTGTLKETNIVEKTTITLLSDYTITLITYI